jgi:hypothetical protein
VLVQITENRSRSSDPGNLSLQIRRITSACMRMRPRNRRDPKRPPSTRVTERQN